MIGSRGSRIVQILGLMAGMLLLAGALLTGSFPASGAAALSATPTAERDFPYHVIARGRGSTPAAGSELVWLVQRGAASGEQRTAVDAFPLGFALAERGTLDIVDANGIRVTELGSGRATFLPAAELGSFGSASGDLVLYIQIALVPLTSITDPLPREMRASEPFPAPVADTLSLELIRGILNPHREADLPASDTPTLLLATDSAIEIETATGDVIEIPNGEIALITERVTIRNPGELPATFVLARATLAATTTARPADQSGLDPALDDAWRRHGCHLNPGNPSCLTVGVAAECAIDHTGPGCRADSDGDRCTDVAEVGAGFDPFDPGDCIGSAAGQPAVNCLFLMENLACNGDRVADSKETECVAEREIRQRRNPSSFSGCAGAAQPAQDDCVLFARDPACDGFAPE